jgi:hypothetical protein
MKSIPQSPSSEQTVPQPIKKFPRINGMRNVITVFTTACHVSPSWDKPIQSTPPHSLSRRQVCNTILLSMPRFYKRSLSQVSSPKPSMHLSSPPYVPHELHYLILLVLITRIILIRDTCNKLLLTIHEKVCITKTNRLYLFREITTICKQNNAK